jgi:hypothetical protein
MARLRLSRGFPLGLARQRHPHSFRVLRFLRVLRAMPFSSFPTGDSLLTGSAPLRTTHLMLVSVSFE